MHGRDAEVDVRGKRLRAEIDELRVTGACGVRQRAATVRVNVDLQPREGLLTELNLIGSNVDEALSRLEKFLDEALDHRAADRPNHSRLRHRPAAPGDRGVLKTHPSVATSPGAADKGGGGVTVVELKE